MFPSIKAFVFSFWHLMSNVAVVNPHLLLVKQDNHVTMFMYMHVHTTLHIRTHTQTHKHTDTQTHRHTDTQTHRHTDTQTHRHTDTQTHRHTDTQTHTHTHTRTHAHTHTHTHTHTLSRSFTMLNLHPCLGLSINVYHLILCVSINTWGTHQNWWFSQFTQVYS